MSKQMQRRFRFVRFCIDLVLLADIYGLIVNVWQRDFSYTVLSLVGLVTVTVVRCVLVPLLSRAIIAKHDEKR